MQSPPNEGMTKRVLLLGAGASRASDYHLPTMVGFFEEGLENQPELKEFLEWFYPGRQTNQYDLEEVMAYLDLSRTRSRLWGIGSPGKDRLDTDELFDLLLRYVRRRLTTPDLPCALHVRIFDQLTREDSVLTLNYDLVADRALVEVESGRTPAALPSECRMGKMQTLIGQTTYIGWTPPILTNAETAWGFYLKLHGSLDWFRCPTPGCSNNVNLFSLQGKRPFNEGMVEGMPCKLCGSALQVYLIPPVAAKRLEDRGRTAFLWNLALREIAQARDLVLIGVSFAPSDFELRWLVRPGLAVRTTPEFEIHIVNPSTEHRTSIKRGFPSTDIIWHEYESVDAYLTGKEVDP